MINNTVTATVIPRRENLHVINVTQLEKNAILVCYDSKCIIAQISKYCFNL